jgi:hypothetical protein
MALQVVVVCIVCSSSTPLPAVTLPFGGSPFVGLNSLRLGVVLSRGLCVCVCSFFTPQNFKQARALIKILEEAKQDVPEELRRLDSMAGSTCVSACTEPGGLPTCSCCLTVLGCLQALRAQVRLGTVLVVAEAASEVEAVATVEVATVAVEVGLVAVLTVHRLVVVVGKPRSHCSFPPDLRFQVSLFVNHPVALTRNE